MSDGIYKRSDSASPILQCEIISGMIHLRARVAEVGASVESLTQPFALIMTQSCDLEREHDARTAGKPCPVEDILVCPAHEAGDVRGTPGVADKWKRIQKNNEERYQFLQSIPVECDASGHGVPELVLDFRRTFSIGTEELLRQFNSGVATRRAQLVSPYLEHVAIRFFSYHARVALPSQHEST